MQIWFKDKDNHTLLTWNSRKITYINRKMFKLAECYLAASVLASCYSCTTIVCVNTRTLSTVTNHFFFAFKINCGITWDLASLFCFFCVKNHRKWECLGNCCFLQKCYSCFKFHYQSMPGKRPVTHRILEKLGTMVFIKMLTTLISLWL